jgi:hypothetical protein
MPDSPLNLNGIPPNSNIMILPSLNGMAFSITNNAGWYDVLFFTTASGAALDISSINFHGELRTTAGDASNRLDLVSAPVPPAPQTLVSGGQSGKLYFSVDVSLIRNLTPGVYVMDILAIDVVSGMVRNLCEIIPIQVAIIQGVTR